MLSSCISGPLLDLFGVSEVSRRYMEVNTQDKDPRHTFWSSVVVLFYLNVFKLALNTSESSKIHFYEIQSGVILLQIIRLAYVAFLITLISLILIK